MTIWKGNVLFNDALNTFYFSYMEGGISGNPENPRKGVGGGAGRVLEYVANIHQCPLMEHWKVFLHLGGGGPLGASVNLSLNILFFSVK